MLRRKRKMSVDEPNRQDFFDDDDGIKIPVNDRRRFNDQGEKIRDDEPSKPAEPVRSAREIDLENKLQAETQRREAAEAKLVGVQAKFDEARNNLEKETAQMRERLRKTL